MMPGLCAIERRYSTRAAWSIRPWAAPFMATRFSTTHGRTHYRIQTSNVGGTPGRLPEVVGQGLPAIPIVFFLAVRVGFDHGTREGSTVFESVAGYFGPTRQLSFYPFDSTKKRRYLYPGREAFMSSWKSQAELDLTQASGALSAQPSTQCHLVFPYPDI